MRTFVIAALLDQPNKPESDPAFLTDEITPEGRRVFSRDRSLAVRFRAESRPTKLPDGIHGFDGFLVRTPEGIVNTRSRL